MKNRYPAVTLALALAAGSPVTGAGRVAWSLIDTDVEPAKAEVWVDGACAGVVDRFDGWPELLEVSAGWHRIEFRHPGYRTLRIDLEAVPFARLRLERSLRPVSEGESRDAGTRQGIQERSRRFFPGLNRIVLPGGILTSRPVRGFRPMPFLRGLT